MSLAKHILIDAIHGERKLPIVLHHHLHQLVAHAPRGVVGNTQMAVQLHRRDPFLVPGHQVDGLEPQGVWQFGRCEDGAHSEDSEIRSAIAIERVRRNIGPRFHISRGIR